MDQCTNPGPKTKHNRWFRRRKSTTSSTTHSSHEPSVSDKLVVNLSDKALSTSETNLLRLGLSFCPSTSKPTQHEILQECLTFDHRVRLNHHFTKQRMESSSQHSQSQGNMAIRWDPISRRDTWWTPNKGLNQNLDNFLSTVQTAVTSHNYQPRGKHNLDVKARNALKRLSMDQDIIIKPADKGGA